MSYARVRALAIVGLLIVAAAVMVGMALAKDTQGSPVAAGCPPGWPVANIQLPEEKQVKINVYNATDASGLARGVADDFRNQGFQIGKIASDPKKKEISAVAVLRYGPKAVGAAHLLRAYFLDEARTEFDIKRTDATVDVVVGTSYKQLATPTEMRQSLSQLGSPTLPEGTCAAK